MELGGRRVPRIRGAFIEPPLDLGAATKRAVLDQFGGAVESVGRPEAIYVAERLPKVLERMKKQAGWFGDMAQVAEFLMAYASCFGGSGDPDRCFRIAVAALFYLCDPFDIVPDHTPGTGYIDDALVLNQALTEMRAESQRVAAEIRRALARHKYSKGSLQRCAG